MKRLLSCCLLASLFLGSGCNQEEIAALKAESASLRQQVEKALADRTETLAALQAELDQLIKRLDETQTKLRGREEAIKNWEPQRDDLAKKAVFDPPPGPHPTKSPS